MYKDKKKKKKPRKQVQKIYIFTKSIYRTINE